MKIQRRSGVNGYIVLQCMSATLSEENFYCKLIRVVPPKSFGPLWTEGLFFYTFLWDGNVSSTDSKCRINA